MNKRKLRASYRHYLFGFSFEAVEPLAQLPTTSTNDQVQEEATVLSSVATSALPEKEPA